MKRNEGIILITVAVVSGAISFFGTRTTATARQESEQRTSIQWLSGAPEEVLELEKSFNMKCDELFKALMNEQKSLALLIEDGSAKDEDILKQADIVSQAHEKLIRSVAEHIIELHRKLPVNQREHLMHLCAESVRGPMRRLDQQRGAYCEGCGRKCGIRCPGSEEGSECCKFCINKRCSIRGKGFTGMLRLSEEQVKAIKQKDPTFEADTENLRQQLIDQKSNLFAMFENLQTSDEDLLQQVDMLISCIKRLKSGWLSTLQSFGRILRRCSRSG